MIRLKKKLALILSFFTGNEWLANATFSSGMLVFSCQDGGNSRSLSF